MGFPQHGKVTRDTAYFQDKATSQMSPYVLMGLHRSLMQPAKPLHVPVTGTDAYCIVMLSSR